jgi:hypothetical protein
MGPFGVNRGLQMQHVSGESESGERGSPKVRAVHYSTDPSRE